jgi:hypothetical protein
VEGAVEANHQALLQADDDILMPTPLCSEASGERKVEGTTTHKRRDIDMLLCGMLSVALVVDQRGRGVHRDYRVDDPVTRGGGRGGRVSNGVDESSEVRVRVELVEVEAHEP